MLLLFKKGSQNRKCLLQTINFKYVVVCSVPSTVCTVHRGLLPLSRTCFAANNDPGTLCEYWLLDEL